MTVKKCEALCCSSPAISSTDSPVVIGVILGLTGAQCCPNGMPWRPIKVDMTTTVGVQ